LVEVEVVVGERKMLGERCQVTIKLDDKGRFAFPAHLRRKMKEAGLDELVLTNFDGGIRGYTPDYFAERIEGPIRELNPFEPETTRLQRAYLWGADACKVDGQGRIRVPQMLRDECGLSGECVLLSILDWIEIWSVERYRAARLKSQTVVSKENNSGG